MSREYNLGGKSIIVDRIEEIFEEGTVSTKAVNNIRQIVGEQRQSKNIQKLTEEINKATSDGVISKAEKLGLKREWASLVSSYSAISDKFTADTALKGLTMFKTLVGIMDELTPIMESIFNDMDSDYTDKDNISKLTNLFVASWEHITLCSQLLEQKLSISDRFYIQLSADRTIVNTLDICVTLLYYINGSYADVTSNPVYEDSDFVWKKTSDESFERTGKVLSLTLDDMSSETENFSMTFTHIYKYNDAAETEIEIKKSISFSISTGTLSQWTWSDAATKADLLMDPLAVWLDYRREFNTKKYLWRRDTDDLLKPDNEKEWLYFRESGLDGISYDVEIISLNGISFRPNAYWENTLYAVVRKNGEDITDELDASLFLWQRKSSGTALQDEEWNQQNKLRGTKALFITNSDCIGRTTFTCSVKNDKEG